MNRKERRAARKAGELDTTAFIDAADRFIDLANRENRKIEATRLHMVFLYAAARYNAFVAKQILHVEKHEEFVEHQVNEYRDMLRQHLADETLDPPPAD